ncbi:DUF4278 domain-containing protein [Cyanothece sp. BG0011]|uniref:DUF4278 domain-containing protein n=1 Tax=Cyanothece sp. BG0011 TaxID=2082950 RepID=UPI000D1DB2E7|nr:DUF4278 domain-containing protein [Cyanothece sp. BG0011]
MQLTYRGVSYNYNPVNVELPSTSSQEHDWRFRNHHHSVTLQPNANLTWRGVKYNNNPTSDNGIKEKSRQLILRHQQKQIDRADSMSLRLAEEVGLA